MATVRLDTKLITDWASFHLVCKEVFGFPDFYGKNMNAWIDCMSCLSVDDGFVQITLSENEILMIEVTETESFNSRLPEIFDALAECSAFVNQRYKQFDEKLRIALIFL